MGVGDNSNFGDQPGDTSNLATNPPWSNILFWGRQLHVKGHHCMCFFADCDLTEGSITAARRERMAPARGQVESPPLKQEREREMPKGGGIRHTKLRPFRITTSLSVKQWLGSYNDHCLPLIVIIQIGSLPFFLGLNPNANTLCHLIGPNPQE